MPSFIFGDNFSRERNIFTFLNDTEIGILAVPVEHAQDATDTMIACGLQAIWNFTPFRIKASSDIVIQNTSIYAHLAVMYNRLDERHRFLK